MRTEPISRQQAVRAHYSALISAMQEHGDHEAAGELADLAVRQGIWRDVEQRPVHYLPELDPHPVFDPSRFWFTAYLEEHAERISAEVDAVTAAGSAGFLPVEEPLLERGRWEQVVFYEAGVRFDEVCARFPVTADIVAGIPEATSGAGVVTLSWLYPGAHIVPHCGGSNARLRVHLGVRVPQGPRLRVGGQYLTWRRGRCLVFDDSFEHEVWHDGVEPRVVLLLDVPHPELDPAVHRRLSAGSQTVADRMAAYMRELGIDRVRMADTSESGDITLFPDRGAARLVRRYLRELRTTAVELRHGSLSYQTWG
ncbi:aspartyl/asparaginyl beta-hydroxylase domain-containing protein [Nocardia sp. NPDC047038]|uniref:aspartyl/asparaginyl beta-hydroxylase domain-containing protein n=1 Tax=Nocardia sp. NPDC047038 TaxID=3154338 RepID=UPI003407BB16